MPFKIRGHLTGGRASDGVLPFSITATAGPVAA